MHTEDEARQKWCPEARMAYRSPEHWAGPVFQGAINRIERNGTEGIRCIASDCMHWRFGRDEDGKYPVVVPRGYCGLSGKP